MVVNHTLWIENTRKIKNASSLFDAFTNQYYHMFNRMVQSLLLCHNSPNFDLLPGRYTDLDTGVDVSLLCLSKRHVTLLYHLLLIHLGH